jgi:hypothetical protein
MARKDQTEIKKTDTKRVEKSEKIDKIFDKHHITLKFKNHAFDLRDLAYQNTIKPFFML